MKYIATVAATLSLADGTKFEITPGIHDAADFPAEAKKHWAFSSYVQPVDEADLEKEKQGEDLTAKLSALNGELDSLKEQLQQRDSTIAALNGELDSLKEQLQQRDSTIAALNGELDSLKAAAPAVDNGEVDSTKDTANAKKQQATK